MKISLKSIPPSGVKLTESEDPAILDIRGDLVAVDSPIICDLELYLSGRLLIVKGALSTSARTVCSRCLDDCAAPISVPRFRAEIEVADPDGTIDLTNSIREDIILALPYKSLCSPECRGLCPRCGHNLNRGKCACAEEQAGGSRSL